MEIVLVSWGAAGFLGWVIAMIRWPVGVRVIDVVMIPVAMGAGPIALLIAIFKSQR